MLCLGYQNILVHVGINDMQDHSKGRLSSDPAPNDTEAHFMRLSAKLEEIQTLCPESTIIVSPTLPTQIRVLNDRRINFDRRLKYYVENVNPKIRLLDFTSFSSNNRDLNPQFGPYNNESDLIHLGSTGIRKLVNIFQDNLYAFRRRADGRSYRDVASSGINGRSSYRRPHYD